MNFKQRNILCILNNQKKKCLVNVYNLYYMLNINLGKVYCATNFKYNYKYILLLIITIKNKFYEFNTKNFRILKNKYKSHCKGPQKILRLILLINVNYRFQKWIKHFLVLGSVFRVFGVLACLLKIIIIIIRTNCEFRKLN